MPSSKSRQAELARLIARPFAHRGLHGSAIVENSRAAFAAALAAGHGIELDVQASADGQAMVFHDEDLARLAEAKGRLAAWSATELGRFHLKQSAETIPTLDEILKLIDGKGGLLIEVKSPDKRVAPLCRSVAVSLGSYQGPVAVMSFNPAVGHWFAAHAPDTLRGLVVTEQGKGLKGRLIRPLALWWSRADFLAYDIRDLPSPFAGAALDKGMPVLTWTVRSLADRARAAEHARQIIYERER